MPISSRIFSLGLITIAAWQFNTEVASAQNNPALFGPPVNVMVGPQRTMPLGPFGPYDLFSVYISPGLYARQPLGHEIIRTGPNGYIYRPVFQPQQPIAPPGVAQPVGFPPVAAASNSPANPAVVANGLNPPLANPPASPTQNSPSLSPELLQVFSAAETAFRVGQYNEALNKVQIVLDANPKLGLAALLHAETLFALGKFPESATALRWAMTNLPRAQWGIMVENYRKLYAYPQKFNEQLQALENFVRQNPTNPAGHFLLGYHYGYSGRQLDGAAQLAAALELFQLDEQARLLHDQFRDPNTPAARPGLQQAPGPANPIPAPRGPKEF